MEKIIAGLKLIGAFALLLAGLCACANSKVQIRGKFAGSLSSRPRSSFVIYFNWSLLFRTAGISCEVSFKHFLLGVPPVK